MHSTDPPLADQEVKEDAEEAHTTPPVHTQHVQISFSDEEEAAGPSKKVNLDGRAESSILSPPANSTHPSTTSSTTNREWRSRSLLSRSEASKEEHGCPPPPQLSLMTSVHSVVSHVQDYIHHM